MTIRWTLESINARFTADGLAVEYGVKIYDHTGRYMGASGITVTDPQWLQLIRSTAEQAVPLMTAAIGYEGGLPQPAPPAPDTGADDATA